MKNIPYFAIGNDELESKAPVGNTAHCPHCKKKHKVKYGTINGKESKLMGFVSCRKNIYLVAVNGKEL